MQTDVSRQGKRAVSEWESGGSRLGNHNYVLASAGLSGTPGMPASFMSRSATCPVFDCQPVFVCFYIMINHTVPYVLYLAL